MASWKERGEVPDSEDEEDDSQNVLNAGSGDDLLQELQKLDNGMGKIIGDIRKGNDLEQASTADSRPVKASDIDRPVTPSQFSMSPRLFRKPPTVDVQQLSEPQEISSEAPLNVDEEMSQSHVRFSCLLPSSNIEPQQVGNLDGAANTKYQGSDSLRDIESNFSGGMAIDWRELGNTDISAYADSLSGIRRSLRQRNPIQLHPYALEGEKYRRTLMARGMRPLRLAQGQEYDRTLEGAQSTQDQDFEIDNENRIMSLGNETPPPLPSQTSTASDLPALILPNLAASQSGGDDDEFPDINQLFEMSNDDFLQPNSKRRKTTYGSRHVSRFSSTSRLPKFNEVQSESSRDVNTVDIPPSPPATSSPVPVFHAPFSVQGSKYLAATSASNRAVSLENTGSESLVGQGVMEDTLPTPMTNSTKHTIDLTAELQSSEDPFTSDADSSSVSSSSEIEQAVQVRRVSKKIRGVLPASWLRLDQQTRQNETPRLISHGDRSSSPVKAVLSRRGVAVPKDATHEAGPNRVERSTETQFLLSDSDTDDEPNVPIFFEPDPDFPHNIYSQTDTGSIMEDNRVDRMLPSRKRQTKLVGGNIGRKKRPVSNSLFIRRDSEHHHQPKITDHLQMARGFKNGSAKNAGRRICKTKPSRTYRFNRSQRRRQKTVPNLGILDVLQPHKEDGERLPDFIRIAARNARLSSGLGRHSPTRKFIKLGNRADTQDAQLVLRNWREGVLHHYSEIRELHDNTSARQPLIDLSENVRNRTAPGTVANEGLAIKTSHVSAPIQNILISRRSQIQPNFSLQSEASSRRQDKSQARPMVPNSHVRAGPSATRPAQLETSVTDYRTRHPNLAFGSTKKALDNLYRKARKQPKKFRDVQVPLFSGNNSSRQHAESFAIIDESAEIEQLKRLPTKRLNTIQHTRRRKQIPKRIDATAAIFRQPSEPLALESLQQDHEFQENLENKGKLLGLGKFGTSYTYHFDVLPLQTDIFFHESTFVGSGRLSKALEISARPFDDERGYTDYHISGNLLRWGPWDGNVSSELCMSFDWIIEQLEEPTSTLSYHEEDALVECITHIIDYVQDIMTFRDPFSRNECLSRIIDISFGFMKHLEIVAHRTGAEAGKLRLLLELSCRFMVFSFQFLRIAQYDPAEVDVSMEFENLLQKSALLTVNLLLSQGLGPVRNLYENLQYLAHREAGIQRNDYASQAWIITMHILHAAGIPRKSFWDVVNSRLIPDDDERMSDARELDRIWYDMFSLLPLTEFNAKGILVRGVKCLGAFENWAVPQRIARKVFELYNSKSRQSPTFNDYCRATFNRCSYLMQNWGWRRHGIIVGTLFDFFATRKLAHLRNEEVYKSPRFLEELNQNPALTIDTGDRCFHILLKIIAVSIMQMRAVGDIKGVRNLVTRVLPNHDRQYPKEKTVYQRDLASLRNHHDLLCTLFWAAPPDVRPSISLIRELVNPETSHHEAYLINLRSWENLTRFILASDPTPGAYLPLAVWHYESFTQLFAQFQSAEREIRDQLRELPSAAQQLIPAHIITTTIRDNQKQVIMALELSLDALKRSIEKTLDLNTISIVCFNEYSRGQACITTGMSLYQFEFSGILPAVETALDILLLCGNQFIDFTQTSEKRIQNLSDDSQEYGSDDFSGLEIETIELAGHLNGELLGSMRNILHTSLQSGRKNADLLRGKIVDVWAMIASALVMARTYDLSDFISESSSLNDLNLDNESYSVRRYASYFLGKVVTRIKDPAILNTTSRDNLSDWLCILIKPEDYFQLEHELLDYFASCDTIIEQGIETFLLSRYGSKHSIHRIEGLKAGREVLIHCTLEAMHAALRDKPSENNRYQSIFRRIQAHMKADLVAMIPRVPETIRHEEFVRSINLLLYTFFRDLCGIKITDDLSSSTNICPRDSHSYDDSRTFVATIRNYCLRLDTTRGKNELNHYILAVLKYAAPAGNLNIVSELLQEAMGNGQRTWRELSHHTLMVLTPSFIHSAFVFQTGWLLVEPFFEATQEHLLEIVDNDRGGAVRGVTKIISSIVNGIHNLMDAHSRDSIRSAIQHGTIYLILMSTRFMSQLFDWLPFVMETFSKEQEEIQIIYAFMTFFHDFACGSKSYLCHPHKAYINSLIMNQTSVTDLLDPTAPTHATEPDFCGGRDGREALFNAFEESMKNGCVGDLNPDMELRRDQALKTLIMPYCGGDDDKFNDIKVIAESLHTNSSSSGSWLFHDMRNSPFFIKAKSALGHRDKTEALHFCKVILAEYSQNWADSVIDGGIEIKFGQEKRVAKSLTAHNLTPKELSEELIVALGDYINRYEIVYGQCSGSQITKRTKKWPINATANLMF